MRISFDDLFTGGDRAVALLLIWINDFLEGLAGGEVATPVDDARLQSLIETLSRQEFPANGGIEMASPFKKAAWIYVLLHYMPTNPLICPFQDHVVPKALSSFPLALSSMVGFALVQECLEGAEFTNRLNQRIRLAKRIDVSDHFFIDLVEASQSIAPETHFHHFSLLFEALAYQSNHEAQYPTIFNQPLDPDFFRPQYY